jgi:peptidoglycan/LPS O-acetylase OafA/YrhL
MTQPERLHALDAVRAIALLLGLVLHGAMAHMEGLADAGWPIVDSSPSDTLGLTFYVIHIFRMATFFLIAGFFGHLVFHRRGAADFARDRRNRILYPLLIWWLPVAIASMAAMIWGLVRQGVDLNEAPEPPIMYPALLPFPLTHLWFLYILIWLYGIALGLRYLIGLWRGSVAFKARVDAVFEKIVMSPIASIMLGVPIAMTLIAIPDWRWWGGVPTPDYSLDPNPASLFIYGYIFGVGWILDRQQHLLQAIRDRWVLNLILGAAATLACLEIVGWQSSRIMDIAEPNHVLLYAGFYGIAMMALTFALIGAGTAFLSEGSRVMRYIADASYWIYVWHLPLIFLLQAFMMNMPLHWSIKFPIVMVATLIPLVLTYDWFVRPGRLGELMNGKRMKRGLPATA